MNWRIVHASVRGTSHIEAGTLCQDVSVADVVYSQNREPVIVAVASDGAGSAPLSHVGAALACTVFHTAIKSYVESAVGGVDLLSFDSRQMLQEVQRAIADRALDDGINPRDLACTLVGAVISASSSAFFQVGDGGIVVGSAESRRVVFWPESGEYANMTYFITDESAGDHLHFVADSEVPSEVAVFTDGLQRLALRYADKSVHDPFFAPLFQNLRQWDGAEESLRSSLIEWMESNAVNERTDDDKTLILAVRTIAAPVAGDGGDSSV